MRKAGRLDLLLKNASIAGDTEDVKTTTTSGTTVTEDQEEAIRAEEDLEEATVVEVIIVMATVKTAGEGITETVETDTAAAAAAAIRLEETTIIIAMALITKRDMAKVTVKATTRATMAKEITTKATTMATMASTQDMGKGIMTIKDPDNHITSRTTISSINSMRSSGSSITRIRASGTSTMVSMGTTQDSRAARVHTAHSEQEQQSDIITSVITHIQTLPYIKYIPPL